jgi:hypothetical protein
VDKELTALKASHARLKRRISTAANELENLRPLKKLKVGWCRLTVSNPRAEGAIWFQRS